MTVSRVHKLEKERRWKANRDRKMIAKGVFLASTLILRQDAPIALVDYLKDKARDLARIPTTKCPNLRLCIKCEINDSTKKPPICRKCQSHIDRGHVPCPICTKFVKMRTNGVPYRHRDQLGKICYACSQVSEEKE